MVLQQDPYIVDRVGRGTCFIMSTFFLISQRFNISMDKKMIADTISKLHKEKTTVWIEGKAKKMPAIRKKDNYVRNPEALFVPFTSKRVIVRHESLDYVPKDNELEMTKYVWEKSTSIHWQHHVATRGGQVLYDPRGAASNTVKYGKPVRKTIYEIVE